MSSFWVQFIINVVVAIIKELPVGSVFNILTVVKNSMEQHPALSGKK
jgi:hypothetical protein